MEIEFKQRNIPFRREQSVPVLYKAFTLGTPYRADFVCHGSIIVELKATGFERARLINFATPRLDYQRFIQSKSHLRSSASSVVELQPRGEE
ncbi:GxxExxY protein [Accumulibacter sp.]|uniref:GxxExxY protein n=1 Tax=Accumulibacter sp. TaxID=2053492 RepID=UPI001A4809CF|nr:GxxExxY protein [Accumulibacter sp.]MBL8399546.1 GxxExxY protein [Accumulibacter sp.]